MRHRHPRRLAPRSYSLGEVAVGPGPRNRGPCRRSAERRGSLPSIRSKKPVRSEVRRSAVTSLNRWDDAGVSHHKMSISFLQQLLRPDRLDTFEWKLGLRAKGFQKTQSAVPPGA